MYFYKVFERAKFTFTNKKFTFGKTKIYKTKNLPSAKLTRRFTGFF